VKRKIGLGLLSRRKLIRLAQTRAEEIARLEGVVADRNREIQGLRNALDATRRELRAVKFEVTTSFDVPRPPLLFGAGVEEGGQERRGDARHEAEPGPAVVAAHDEGDDRDQGHDE
jgi:hypothetical protein